jgi:hypothetical protein
MKHATGVSCLPAAHLMPGQHANTPATGLKLVAETTSLLWI